MDADHDVHWLGVRPDLPRENQQVPREQLIGVSTDDPTQAEHLTAGKPPAQAMDGGRCRSGSAPGVSERAGTE
jgi:hypothetical protein